MPTALCLLRGLRPPRPLSPTFWVAVVMVLSLLGTAALWWRHLDEEPSAGLLAALPASASASVSQSPSVATSPHA